MTKKDLRSVFIFLLIFLGTILSAGAFTSRSSPVPNKGLSAHWSFDRRTINGTAVSDLTTGNNTGTIVGGATSADGQFNEGLSFDGIDDYVEVGNLGLTGPATVSMWIYPDDVTETTLRRLFSQSGGATSQGGALGVGGDNGTEQPGALFVWNGGTWQRLTDNNRITTGRWQHIAVVYSAGQATAYVDGATDSNVGTTSFDFAGGTALLAGRFLNTHGEEFDGGMDDVRIYNRALSSAEITDIAQSFGLSRNSHGPTSNLVGHWSFNEGTVQGTGVRDLTNRGNNGTITGGVTAVKGKLNEALSFDGTSGSVDISSGASARGADTKGAISLWVKPTSDNGTEAIFFSVGSGAGNTDLWFEFSWQGATNAIGAYLDVSNSRKWGGGTANGSATQYLNQWVHLALVQDGVSPKLYVNGVESMTFNNTTDKTAWISALSPTKMRIGSYSAASPSLFFPGSIDDVRIYNRELTQTEVTALYRLGAVTKQNSSQVYLPPAPGTNLQSGLVGFWDFSGNRMGTTSAQDLSGNGKTGWLIGDIQKTVGKIGQGLLFRNVPDTTGYHVDISSMIPARSGDTTGSVSFWAKIQNPLSTWEHVAFSLETTGGSVSDLYIDFDWRAANRLINFVVQKDAVYQVVAQTPAGSITPFLDKWAHVVVTQDGTAPKIYLNGVSQTISYSVQTAKGSWFKAVLTDATNDATSARIGDLIEGATHFSFPGIIDEFRIYDRELSQAEVTALYRAAK